ncbi:MAG: hypothetical protein GC189_03305 [Alphaproteobacteria bacterium]|nr:hypothetical protein [Alphaproteobacteria bacterium]
MRAKMLFRLAGVAAFAGGAARMVSSFPLRLPAQAQEALYDGIDVLLLLGLMGLYLRKARAMGLPGLLCFLTAVAALSFIGGPDADPFPFSTYQTGAALLGAAMAAFGVVWILARQRPLFAAFYWILAVVAAIGLPYAGAPFAAYAGLIAGLLFGAGFAFAGIELIVRPEGQK